LSSEPNRKKKRPFKHTGHGDERDAWYALLDLFSVVDVVYTSPGVFDTDDDMRKALGQIYRSWLNAREQLDPEFDRSKYRIEIKAGVKAKQWLPQIVRQAKRGT
jgi:hypothetical protein